MSDAPCPDCRGSGWKYDAGLDAVERCHCARALSQGAEWLVRNAQVPKKYAEMSRSSAASLGAWAELLIAHMDQACRAVAAGRSVLLLGPNGRGKTGVAMGVMHERLDRGYKSQRYVFAPLLLEDFYDQRGEGGVGELVRELCDPDLLVVDDLGWEQNVLKPSEYAQRLMGLLLWGRDAEGKPTIVTSSRPRKEVIDAKGVSHPGLLELYGRAVDSRLALYETIEITEPPDFRRRSRS